MTSDSEERSQAQGLQQISVPFRLESHPTARNAAIAISGISAGSTILSSTPLATVLVDSEKGKRCDFCLYPLEELQRCTGCKVYWYCDQSCQMKAWKANHKRLCSHIRTFMKSPAAESSDAKLHTLLLAHLMVEHANVLQGAFERFSPESRDLPWIQALPHPITALLTLLPNERHIDSLSDLSTLGIATTPVAKYLSARFANNNFALHSSRMDVFGHGVFPLASRAFNHSCAPNAVPIYQVSANHADVEMKVVALRKIPEGEEITVPYVDPALPYKTRQMHLKYAYGFTCDCPCCQSPFSIDSDRYKKQEELSSLETRLQDVLELKYQDPQNSKGKVPDLKLDIIPGLPSTYLPSLSEEFSQASHWRDYNLAIQKGKSLLGLYFLLYSANYPMIGLHALELAKTYWNAFVTDTIPKSSLTDMKKLLLLVESILIILLGNSALQNSETDEVVSEFRTLRDNLNSEMLE